MVRLNPTATLLVVCLALIAGTFALKKVLTGPDSTLLINYGDAHWIKMREPTRLVSWKQEARVTFFKTSFNVQVAPRDATLTFRAFRSSQVVLNGRRVFQDTGEQDPWNRERHIDLSPHLSQGPATLIIAVGNDLGPPALHATAPGLGLHSGENWETSLDGKEWTKASLVDETPPPETARAFPIAPAFLRQLPFTIPVLLLVWLWTMYPKAGERWKGLKLLLPTDTRLKWFLIVAWLVLGVNNIAKLGLEIGMDAPEHYHYIGYVAENMRIPLANEGQQTFQPPLFYVLAGGLLKFLSIFLSPEGAARWVRVLPLLCGLAQIEIIYRTLRLLFPERADMRICGLLIGGLMPMNIYISQVVGNEPMLGLTGGLTILSALGILVRPEKVGILKLAVLGTFLGLALLSKASALVLAVLVLFPVGVWIQNRGYSPANFAKGITATYAPAALISGWFYVRNQIHFGKFIIGGWDSEIGISWWQYPGYRTVSEYFRFGDALSHPVYSNVHGFWDGLYAGIWMDAQLSGMRLAEDAPGWNFTPALATVWWSLVPTLCILAGMAAIAHRSTGALKTGDPDELRAAWPFVFCVAALTLFVAAIGYHHLTVPFYSSVKPTYALSATVCLAAVAARGIDLLGGHRYIRASVYSALMVWAIESYAGYFII